LPAPAMALDTADQSLAVVVDFDERALALATIAESSTFVPYSGATLFWRGVFCLVPFV